MGGVGKADSSEARQRVDETGSASSARSRAILERVRGTGAFSSGEVLAAKGLYSAMLSEHNAALERLRSTHGEVPAAAAALTAFATVCIGLVKEVREASASDGSVAARAGALHSCLVELTQGMEAAIAEAREAAGSPEDAGGRWRAIPRRGAGQRVGRRIPPWIIDACFETYLVE